MHVTCTHQPLITLVTAWTHPLGTPMLSCTAADAAEAEDEDEAAAAAASAPTAAAAAGPSAPVTTSSGRGAQAPAPKLGRKKAAAPRTCAASTMAAQGQYLLQHVLPPPGALTGLPQLTTSIKQRDYKLMECLDMCRRVNSAFERNTAGRTTGRFHGNRMLDLLGEADPDAADMLSDLDPVAMYVEDAPGGPGYIAIGIVEVMYRSRPNRKQQMKPHRVVRMPLGTDGGVVHVAWLQPIGPQIGKRQSASRQ